MGKSNKMKSTRNGKKDDGTFRSKKIKHDPQAESARAVFGVNEKNNHQGICHTADVFLSKLMTYYAIMMLPV